MRDLKIVRVRFEIISIINFQTKKARHEVQLPLYYSHFEIAKFSQYQYLFYLVAGLLKRGNKTAFTSHFAPKQK